MDAEKRARILKRTLSGSALAGSLALLLVWNSRSQHGLVLFVALVLVLFAGVLELTRMGSLREWKLGAPIGLAALGCAGLLYCARARWIAADELQLRGWNLAEALEGAHGGGYSRVALFACALGAAVQALALAFPARRILAWLAGIALLVFVLHEPLSAGSQVLPAALLCGVLLVGALPAVLAAGRGRELAGSAVLALWLTPALPYLFSLYGFHGTAGLVALLAISKIGDTAGYYGGSTFGKRHPFPGISPGKTEWGCVASFLGATLLALLLHVLGVLPQGPLGIYGALITGASLNLAAQAGDLFESWIKRRAGVKDSSSAFGPSGGLLDQLDSFLFTIPMAAATWPWIFPGR